MSDQTTRPSAPAQPYLAEFASPQYFEKLRQQNAQQQQQHQQQLQRFQQLQQQHQGQHYVPPQQTQPEIGSESSIQASQFILPLRESKIDTEPIKPEAKKEKKGFFGGLRHKKSLLLKQQQPRPAQCISEPVPAVPVSFTLPIRASTESTRKSVPLYQQFLGLPNELQVQIVSSLPLNDILNLRLASKSWHSLITINEAPIVRYHLDNHIPAYALRLYPLGDNKLNFHYLCGLWHRLHVAAKLSYMMCEWITKDIFLRTTEAHRAAFAPQHERMRRRLIPLLFTVFHFFEMYRKLHLEHIADNDGFGLHHEPYTLNPIEAKIMSMYDDRTLLRVHEIFPLVISSFCRRLRPPTYIGRVERSLRGYIRERPTDDIHVAILCLGGLRQVERLWEVKGYNSRRAEVDIWYSGLTKEKDILPEPSKTKRAAFGFGRKKSTSNPIDFVQRASLSDPPPGRRSSAGSIASNHTGWDPAWVFNTSLAQGMPMSPLDKDHAECLLKDLPILQQIWVQTGELLILERGIVERTQDIRRNQTVLLDLIREDGIDEEDEWWYGASIPESIRPSLAGLNDDAD